VKYAQGHYIASPRPVEELQSLIEGLEAGGQSSLGLKVG
jgi:EAL domain-containing protein (putative c-di-GMP-specific phosphodiesterase class I)